MKAGTITGANISHLLLGDGTKRLARPIIIREKTTSGNPEKLIFPMALANQEAITVPMFVNIGDVVRIDTRTGEYMERI